eukprot:CAMPEP_0176422894 /NCGR_PEP_ID=MMETSP0127-20121128/9984_1 /TAXON_ID=938130 /ORGANISM="Platyophrya macrostoma, Strain WH" /LENGTH=78 /DNA_ID=CAMNT_0017803789 /DNA_START=731 /DNA_END=964 /DNA_ORIENTATION=+
MKLVISLETLVKGVSGCQVSIIATIAAIPQISIIVILAGMSQTLEPATIVKESITFQIAQIAIKAQIFYSVRTARQST